MYEDEKTGERIPLIDGGVVANNPVLYAYKEALRLYPETKTFHILSLGTGKSANRLQVDTSNGGVFGGSIQLKGLPHFIDSMHHPNEHLR